MGAAEPAPFDTVGETVRTNHYEPSFTARDGVGSDATLSECSLASMENKVSIRYYRVSFKNGLVAFMKKQGQSIDSRGSN
jgi:hypothetical protein